MKILVVGTGTIGSPLIRLFLVTRKNLGFDEVIFHKNKPEQKCRGRLELLLREGAKLAVYQERVDEFKELLSPTGLAPSHTFTQALNQADVIVDCTDKGIARRLKEQYYQHLAGKFGFIAQGSETGFGKPLAFGINDQALIPETDKFIQVVSCNTHQVLCLLKTLAFNPASNGIEEWNFDNLVRARFYLARRASDISQSESTIGAETSKPSDPKYGSHQGADAARVLATVTEKEFDIHTVADTFNNSYMHVVNFEVTLREKVDKEEVERRFRKNPLTAVTYEMTNNQVFSTGRDHGHYGRILNQTVVCLPTIQVINNGHEIHGRCFTPQDGNALLSSVAAALWLKYPKSYKDLLTGHFFKPPFLFDEV
ncbi:MAG: hypothetical protein HYT63_03590 [Candidatus Yanofskybacteria bacterium]|nr:hypothetical protein [Candidatus Yanofskybacteria bacterium]